MAMQSVPHIESDLDSCWRQCHTKERKQKQIRITTSHYNDNNTHITRMAHWMLEINTIKKLRNIRKCNDYTKMTCVQIEFHTRVKQCELILSLLQPKCANHIHSQ